MWFGAVTSFLNVTVATEEFLTEVSGVASPVMCDQPGLVLGVGQVGYRAYRARRSSSSMSNTRVFPRLNSIVPRFSSSRRT